MSKSMEIYCGKKQSSFCMVCFSAIVWLSWSLGLSAGSWMWLFGAVAWLWQRRRKHLLWSRRCRVRFHERTQGKWTGTWCIKFDLSQWPGQFMFVPVSLLMSQTLYILITEHASW